MLPAFYLFPFFMVICFILFFVRCKENAKDYMVDFHLHLRILEKNTVVFP